VTIVDCKHLLLHLDEKNPQKSEQDGIMNTQHQEVYVVNEAERQIAFADVIIINKTDLVSEDQVQIIEQRVKNVNRMAPTLRAVKSRVDLDKMLNIHAFNPDPKLLEPYLQIDDAGCPHHHDDVDTDHLCTHTHHTKPHDNSITTCSVTVEGSLDLAGFNKYLGNIVWETKNVFRMKGVVSVTGENEKYALQGVHDLFTVEGSGIEWKENEARFTKLVFIGRDLERDKLASELRSLTSK